MIFLLALKLVPQPKFFSSIMERVIKMLSIFLLLNFLYLQFIIIFFHNIVDIIIKL